MTFSKRLNPSWQLPTMTQGRVQSIGRFKSHHASNFGMNCGAPSDKFNKDVSSLCMEGRLKEALDVLDVMDQGGIEAYSCTYGCLLQGCINMKALTQGRQVHAHIIKSGSNHDIFIGRTLVKMYVKCGSVADARKVFDNMPKHNLYSWNAMIAGYAENGHGKEALRLYEEMQHNNVKPDKFIITSVLKACANLAALKEGKWLHAYILEMGIELDVFLEAALINMYAKCGSIEDARHVFDRMPKRDTVAWNSMIAGYAQHGQGKEALQLLRQMQQEGLKPDRFSWNAVIAGYSQHGRAEEAFSLFLQMQREGMKPDVVSWTAIIAGYAQQGHGEEALKLFQQMQQKGVKPNVVSWNSIIAGYAQHGHSEVSVKIFRQMQQEGMKPDIVSWNTIIAGYAQHGHCEEALHFFTQMRHEGMKPDVVSWNAMIAGYAWHGHGETALVLLHQMQQEGVNPDVVSWSAVIAGYAHHGRCDEALELFRQMQQEGIKPNLVSWNGIIAGYAQHGRANEALELFQRMQQAGVKPNVVSWNVLISGFAQHGCAEEALKLFWQMQRAGLKPDSVTFTSILKSCAGLAALEHGRCVHDNIINSGFESDLSVGNALVDMYAKCGSIEAACQVFEKMSKRDVVSWNAMIAGYAMHGLGKEALQLFERMQREGLKADHITFIGVLSACSYVGLVGEGYHHFHSINQVYDITLTMEHYAGMVDLLARAGCLNEAVGLLNKMPIQPHAAVWRTLLGSCRTHGNVELAECIVECAIKLEPMISAAYVLLSNIYGAAGRWDDHARVREILKDVGVKKQSGDSWI